MSTATSQAASISCHAVALLVSFPKVAGVAIAAWVADFGIRLATMEWGSENKGGGEQHDNDRDETAR